MPDWLYAGVSDEIAARRLFFADDGHQQQELYADAWKMVADRYASNDLVVAADMMNEPYTKNALTVDELHLDQLYQTLGSGHPVRQHAHPAGVPGQPVPERRRRDTSR